jgi:hypothetical protein
MDVSGQTVSHGHITAQEKSLIFIELETGWVLKQVWMFWRKDSSVASSKI